jgi:hypothetical protein
VIRRSCHVVVSLAVLMWATPALAQGPLTGVLPENDPESYGFRIGPLEFTPSLVIREIGIDTNVFDQPVNPKRDFVAAFIPNIDGFARMGPVRVVLQSAAELTYFHTFESERSIAKQVRARADLEVLRIRPWVAGAFVQTRQRPNREIDFRVQREETEMAAGAIFEISPTGRLFVGVTRFEPRYLAGGPVFQGVDLSELTRQQDSINAGIRLELTPFTTLTVLGMTQDERFPEAPTRNAKSRMASAEVTISSEAIIRGRAQIGFRDFDPVDPTVDTYKGIYSNVSIGFTLFSSSAFTVNVVRDVQHSFEELEAYFIATVGEVVYTQLLAGPYDVQVRGSYGTMGYGNRLGLADRSDSIRTFGVGVGYNLEDRSRIGITYEYSDRLSTERFDRRFDRRRLFASWTYTF